MVSKPADSLNKYVSLFDRIPARNDLPVVLDYGSGNLRNSIFMHRKGYEVFAVDVPSRVKISSLPRLKLIWPEELYTLPKNIDVVICTFVLNLISPAERVALMEAAIRKMNTGGYMLIETRGVTLSDIDKLTVPRGFARIHCQSGRFTVIALYQFCPDI